MVMNHDIVLFYLLKLWRKTERKLPQNVYDCVREIYKLITLSCINLLAHADFLAVISYVRPL